MEKMRMHKKMAMSGKAPSMKKYKSGGMAKKPITKVRGGMAARKKAIEMTVKRMLNDPKVSNKERRDEKKTGRKFKANLRDIVKTETKKK